MRAVNKKAKEILDTLTEGVTLDGPKKIANNDGYMAVHVEFVFETNIGDIFSIAHYYEQNGDLMRDPEMCFLKSHDGQYYPTYFRQDGIGGMEQESVVFEPGEQVMTKPKMQKDQALFAAQWMQNIKEQQGL